MKYMLKCSEEKFNTIRAILDSYKLEYSSDFDLLFVSKNIQEKISIAYISFDENNLLELESYLSKLSINTFMSEKLIVRDDTSSIPINKHDIEYIYAGNNKCYVVADNEYKINLSLSELETRLRGDGFLRINKSEIVNLKKINRIRSWFSNRYLIHLGSEREFVVTNNYYKVFKNHIGL
jgi:two-component system LytT family response regulator/two-component system response regulator LytT